MTKAIPVSPVTLDGRTWRRSADYLFASKKILCPVDLTEVSKASVNMPLAFVKSDDSYHLVAVNGLAADQNLYTDSAGRWLADYVPQEYRLFPFLLAQTEDGRQVLCFDEDSGLLSDSADGLPFFADDQLSELVKKVMDTLSARFSQRLRTQQLVQQLADLGLIKSWNLEYSTDSGNKRVEGLNCIDEAAITQLTGDQLATLRDSGALGLMYCQMLSMHQVQYLVKLLKRQAAAAAKQPLVPELQLDASKEDSGTLSFDNL